MPQSIVKRSAGRLWLPNDDAKRMFMREANSFFLKVALYDLHTGNALGSELAVVGVNIQLRHSVLPRPQVGSGDALAFYPAVLRGNPVAEFSFKRAAFR